MNPAYAFDGRGTVYRPNKHGQYNNNNNSKRRPFAPSYGNHRRHPHSISSAPHLHGQSQGQQPPSLEPVVPPNANPDKLMELLKSSGEYDRLRKQIFTTFQNSDMRKVLLSRVDGVVTECLEKDLHVLSRPPEATHADLMRELDTYPFVERQVICVPIWREDEWIASVERAVRNLIHDRPVNAAPPSAPVAPTPPAPAPPKEPPRNPAPWRVKETAPLFIPDEVIDDGLGEDDMAIDDD